MRKMRKIRQKILLVICSLPIVLALKSPTLTSESLIPRKSAKSSNKLPLEEFEEEFSQLEMEDENELKMIEDRMGNDTDIGEGVVEGNGGCESLPGENSKTSGADQLVISGWVIFPTIYLSFRYNKLPI